MMVIDNKFDIGEIVYCVTDTDQKEKQVTGLLIRPGGLISYECYAGSNQAWHYDFELSKQKNVLITINQ